MNYAKTISLYDDNIGSVSYVEHMGSDLTVVNSARVSFGVEKTDLDDRDRKLINYLIKHKHTSTLEHNLVTFKFVVPLFILCKGFGVKSFSLVLYKHQHPTSLHKHEGILGFYSVGSQNK